MRLERFAIALSRRLAAIDRVSDRLLIGQGPTDRFERWAIQDGLLSHKWQAWCGFCRTVILASVQGAETAGGVTTTSGHFQRPEAELTWIASRAARSEPIGNVRPLAAKRYEPTWGDISKTALIVNALAPSNGNTLATGLSMAGPQVGHLQTIRNASAHLNSETMADVRALALFYRGGPIVMPADAMFWVDRRTNMPAYRRWSDLLVNAARFSIG
jgi:hypothetical protein